MASMTVGLVGLGRMGLAIADRLLKAGHQVVGFDFSEEAAAQARDLGARTVQTLKEISPGLDVLWIMVPAGDPVDAVLNEVSETLEQQTIVVDGGNSNFKNTQRRARELAQKNITLLDCGTSGGLLGRKIGFSLMIGGEQAAYEKLEPVFKAIAAPEGYDLMGPAGAGHYVKMIHNGVEYSMLQAYAEGFNLLKHGSYENLDLEKISRVWSHGSVVRSWTVELAHEVFEKDQDLKDIAGDIGENKTGRWTLDEAQEKNIPMDLLQKSLDIRKWSRETGGNFATKVVAMLRHKFGGHPVKKVGDKS